MDKFIAFFVLSVFLIAMPVLGMMETDVAQDPAPGEAVVWYLGHCGFAVRTQRNLLIFDYQEQLFIPRRIGDRFVFKNGRIQN